MVSEFHLRIDHSAYPKFNSHVEQYLVKLYLPLARTPNYQGPLLQKIRELTPKNIIKIHFMHFVKLILVKR